MSDTDPDHETKHLEILKPHLSMIEILLSTLSEQQLNLMRRAQEPNQSTETRDSTLSDENAIIFHALTVGLVQLMESITSNTTYHRQAQVELSSILHSCIKGEDGYTLAKAELVLSKIEGLNKLDDIFGELFDESDVDESKQ